jgi:flagellar hook protein FlgE
MTLQTALSGLQGAQTGLNTVSNDLANASTTAFKSQTALFADVYPANARDVPGIGVNTSAIQSNFSQGGLVPTGNPLDAAIQGNGFFVVSENGTQQYTRDGSFELDADGRLVNSDGAAVQGYSLNSNGTVGATLGPLTVNTGAVPANATSRLGLTLNLNSGDQVIPAATAFDAANPASYDEATSVVTYDSLGNANRVGLYFVQNPPAAGSTTPNWTVYAQAQTAAGATVGAVQTLTNLTFSTSGALTAGSPATLNVTWGNGAANSTVAFDFAGTTLGAQNFAVAGTTNDGYAPGNYSGTTISASGALESTYTNGQTVSAGNLALANFINPNGLTSISGNLFGASSTSGQPVLNVPGVGEAGAISGGNLEQSNASTSSLLVSLIQYQQAYQANTSVIQTEQQDSTRLTQI